MTRTPVKRRWTVEEYLSYEEETGVKHEYIDGDIYAMTGGSGNHALVMMNCGAELNLQLRGSNCRAYFSDLKVQISTNRYVYPDLSIVCDETHYADENKSVLLNPIMVVEVVSPSSANYDRLQKADYYRSLPSLQIYLILEQDKPFAQVWFRREDGWLLQEFSGLDATIALPAINSSLPLSEVYRGIVF
ncbi:MAG: Uma2 family endonuclease [Anaerolineae bacterium]|nr:Uma2 family endonuclease [Anaerolineae bacterium]